MYILSKNSITIISHNSQNFAVGKALSINLKQNIEQSSTKELQADLFKFKSIPKFCFLKKLN